MQVRGSQSPPLHLFFQSGRGIQALIFGVFSLRRFWGR